MPSDDQSGALSRMEALNLLGQKKDELDGDCPECGRAYEFVDMTQDGELYFQHDEGACTQELSEVDSVAR